MMFEDLDRKLESKIFRQLSDKNKHSSLPDGFKKNKVVNEVLDKKTMMTLYEMINSHIISYVNGVVSAGKESVLFWAVGKGDQNYALKIYLVSTSNFKNRMPYLAGDPRFSRIKKGTRNIVNLWAKKEFRNLSQCYECGIPVPKPVHVSNNVLAMEFIGKGGNPAKTLLESQVNQNDYELSISLLKRLYHEAKLVHGDFSEYNIFKVNNDLVLFDFGSAVDIGHLNSTEFLKRDINNISRFFVKRGLTVANPSDVLNEVIN